MFSQYDADRTEILMNNAFQVKYWRCEDEEEDEEDEEEYELTLEELKADFDDGNLTFEGL